MSIGYSILSILVIFKYSFDERRTNEQANNVRIFMKFENGSTIKLPLNIKYLVGSTPDNNYPLGDSHKMDLETSNINETANVIYSRFKKDSIFFVFPIIY